MENYLYHGTINKFVPNILKEGLVPHRDDNGWDATDVLTAKIYEIAGIDKNNAYNPKKDDDAGYVYLASRLESAVAFAKAKADYFRAKPGEIFYFMDMALQKGRNAPVIDDAVATILRIKATDQIILNLELDPKSSGYRIHGNIQPSLIES
jgi:hypothetical protein